MSLDDTSGQTAETSETRAAGSDIDHAAVRRWLTAELGRRVESLLAEMSPAARRSDAPTVLESLVEDPTGTIRQPPAAARKALALVRSGDGDIAELVESISTDPGLAQALLKHANSAYYSLGKDASVSVLGAIERVGSRGVESVVLANMVGGMLCRPGAGFDTMVAEIWDHMVRSAPIARHIAPAFGADPEIAFTLALLHDAGKLVTFDRVARLRQHWRRDVSLPGPLLVRVLRRLHEPIGGLAVLQWGLGPEAAWTIAHHHRDPAPESHDPAGEAVCLAERFDRAYVRREPLDLDELWSRARLTGTPALVERYIPGLESAA